MAFHPRPCTCLICRICLEDGKEKQIFRVNPEYNLFAWHKMENFMWWGGFAPAVEGHQASLSVDGYMYSPETKEWSSVATPYDAEGNEISLGGGMGTSFGEGMILCAGGVDKDIFLKALQGIYAGKEYLSHPVEWYRFNRNLLLYHPQTDKWTTLGEYEQGARAGAVIVSQDGFHYIINGELKPGIRTNEINRIKEKRR